ncbi:DUF6221 family protein [Streptomyces reniochalinae]|uniref:Uncharacterized protein n=1 Tax=Streptomyces reniochalinae TaxID=2250578 RepID=A0A367EUD1_9ACTN|nr:DUF6221 family protein [Streptomyces reniochalinae]RCG21726.1 hypothetical protein DQ392_08425 [Streptomyces reniochalinae]
MTGDLVAFLRARLDEDEQAARATMWEGSGNRADWSLPASATVGTGEDEFYAGDRTVAAHIARHDPARVLAEVDAKRRIIELHHVVGGWQDEDGNDHGDGCGECGHSEEYSDRDGWCETLRLLALPHADHPEYREEWKP